MVASSNTEDSDREDATTSTPLDDYVRRMSSHPETTVMDLLYKSNATSSGGHDKDDAAGNESTPSSNDASKLLRSTSQFLFQRVEYLGKLYHDLEESSRSTTTTTTHSRHETTPTLSGLDKLYTGDYSSSSSNNNNNEKDHDNTAVDDVAVDAETIWGQVELQNVALQTLLKRSLKQLTREADKQPKTSRIRILDETALSDNDESNSRNSNENMDGSDSEAIEDESPAKSDGEDDDDDAKRIKARMERAMDDMGDDMDGTASSSDSSDDENDTAKEMNEEEFEKDRDAANLHDGFFNLQEMEDFADEEEEYLPETAYGEEKPDVATNDKRTFHQRQRDGDMDGDSDDDDDDNNDDNNDLLFRRESTIRRRKYRKEDEVDALHELYNNEARDHESDDDSEMDAVNMTAVDLFGKPNTKYFDKYNSKNGGDDDSWNDYEFDDENDKTGWNDEQDTDAESHGRPKKKYENDDDESSASEEEVLMKSTDSKKGPAPPTKQAKKIQAQTEQIEKEMMAEKPWQMIGEAASSSRPLNSLLDLTPEFEVASKLAPVITVEHTENLEEIIKKRVLAEDWDDVIPRELPDVGWHKKRGELPEVSQEKSKLGLGELYEREYLKKAIGYDVAASEKETEETKIKNEMKTLFANLCSKLDALSNYHFAPRPIADEADVRIVTQPAIAMEEVLPLHVSGARGVAPEEVYGAKRGRDGILRADSELEQQERKRLRGSKKATRRKARQAKLADEKLISRLQPGSGLNNPYEKRKMQETLTAARAGGQVTTGLSDMNDYGGSTTFFQRMQKEAENAVHGTGDHPAKKKAKPSAKSSAYLL